MTLPDFLIAGAQKSGTTWLARRLSQHPEVFLPDREVHFFDKAHNFRRGLGWYESQFRAAGSEQVVGEKTPDYIWVSEEGAEGHLSDIPGRIRRTLPEVKLLFVLRDPVDRAISAARHVVRSGRVGPWWSLDELLVRAERERLEGHGVLDYGRYHRHLRAYLDQFPRERILVLVFEEDVVGTPATGLRKVCRFLEVEDHAFEDLDEPEHKRGDRWLRILARWVLRRVPLPRGLHRLVPALGPRWKPTVSRSTREQLTEIYRPENEKLFELLGREIPAWRS